MEIGIIPSREEKSQSVEEELFTISEGHVGEQEAEDASAQNGDEQENRENKREGRRQKGGIAALWKKKGQREREKWSWLIS